jgi:hypothetical protein
MKRFIFALAMIGCIFTANAQEVETTQEAKNVSSPSKGDYFDGLTRPVTFNRMIPPYLCLQTFNR